MHSCRRRGLARGLTDDTSTANDRRLAVHRERTEPLLAFDRRLVRKVDGNRPARPVHQEIVAGLASRASVS